MMAQTNLAPLFARMAEIPGIEQVTGDIIPLPGADGTMFEHLFVNLVRSVTSDPKEMLSALRDNTQRVLELIEKDLKPFRYASVVISFYAIPREGTNIRLYRTRILAKDISSVQVDNYTSFAQGEESHYPTIQPLLAR